MCTMILKWSLHFTIHKKIDLVIFNTDMIVYALHNYASGMQ